MTKRFDYFVMFAEMRTGSNFLEANLNEFDGVTCYGEAFNPHFIGYPNRSDLLGISQTGRDADPVSLIQRMVEKTDGLPGFRFFNDHDPRILRHCLPDERCAKIILTRNPLDSYVSWKIARATDQWKLTDVKRRRSAKVDFVKSEFERFLAKLQKFQTQLVNGLQVTGQTAFYIAYEDIPDIDVLNGLARFLGVDSRIGKISKSLKRQNPAPLSEKVANYKEMQAALSDWDHFNLNRTPNFEPRRGPAVPAYIAAATAPLIYLPIKSGPVDQVQHWMAALDSIAETELLTGFNQKTLRKWKRQHPGHRSFTVVRHPVRRAYAAFNECILPVGLEDYQDIRETLRKVYHLPIPPGAIDETYDLDSHRRAFLSFLGFLKQNLSDQTSIRIDPAWCSQTQALQGFGQFILPDMVLREENLQQGLAFLADQIGIQAPKIPELPDDGPYPLAEVYTPDIEAAARAAYQRDYMMFGYKALM